MYLIKITLNNIKSYTMYTPRISMSRHVTSQNYCRIYHMIGDLGVSPLRCICIYIENEVITSFSMCIYISIDIELGILLFEIKMCSPILMTIRHCVCKDCICTSYFQYKLKFTYITIMTRNCFNKYDKSIKISKMIKIIK